MSSFFLSLCIFLLCCCAVRFCHCD